MLQLCVLQCVKMEAHASNLVFVSVQQFQLEQHVKIAYVKMEAHVPHLVIVIVQQVGLETDAYMVT